MIYRFVLALASCSVATGAAIGQTVAFRGTHIGFDTAGGVAGQPLLLRTRYGTSGAPETEQWAWQFQAGGLGGQLQTRTSRYAVDPNAPFDIARFNLWHDAPSNYRPSEGGGVSPVNGWYAQSTFSALAPATERASFNPTGGDAFVSGGRLVGGFFAYEIMSVVPLDGSPVASFGMSMMVNPSGNTVDALRQLVGINTVGSVNYDVLGLYDASQAGGGALSDRSIALGYGNHFEGWGMFISAKGHYEVTMRVYDQNGVYTPSEPFMFQVNSVPAPSVVATFGGIGALIGRRRRSTPA